MLGNAIPLNVSNFLYILSRTEMLMKIDQRRTI